jgi:hypothetical protein
MTRIDAPNPRAKAPAGGPLLSAAAAQLARSLAVADTKTLKPGELLASLNSTPLGTVLTDKKLRRHRHQAGAKFSDAAGKRLDLLRYVAWLANQRQKTRSAAAGAEKCGPPDRSPPRSRPPIGSAAAQSGGSAANAADAYELKKERERARNAAASESGRDIGELPPVEDPERRSKALASPEFFCATYFPRRFTKNLSADQKASINELASVIYSGGVKAYAAPRGDGKTTRAEVMTIWAILTGKRRFVAFVGATRAAADESLQSIKGEFETNQLLLADFPEVCYPVQALEGIYNRCKGQLYQGEPTRMKWSGDMLVLPTIANSPASGAVICCRGITGRVRGMKCRSADGATFRPDLAIVDDPQTEKSAASPNQCKKRIDTITGAILGLAGPGESIACFVPCTVIVKGDLADQILDREQMPAFQGVRTKLVYDWPTAEKEWDQYAELRRQSLRTYGDGRLGNALYKKHKKAMDAGAKVAWPERFDADAGELSAIQHAMNLRIDRPDTFDAEYQNEPRDETADDDKLPTAAQIVAKQNGLARGVVPLKATQLTAFIDVQQRLLYHGECAWAPDFTGHVVDYGSWPDQGRHYFNYRDAAKTIQDGNTTAGVPGAIRAALDKLLHYLMTREFTREDGLVMKISKVLIDSGNWADVVYQTCRESPYGAAVLPSKGMGIKADRAPISEWRRQDGQVLGEEWMLSRVENKRAVRLLTYDTNFWKTRLYTALNTAAGDRGCLSLCKGAHDMLAAHLGSETRDKTFGRGRTVYVYKLRPEKPDNHLLDCVVGNEVAASLLGCRLIGNPIIPKPAKPKTRPRVSPLSC